MILKDLVLSASAVNLFSHYFFSSSFTLLSSGTRASNVHVKTSLVSHLDSFPKDILVGVHSLWKFSPLTSLIIEVVDHDLLY